MDALLIFLGSGIGGLCRYFLSVNIYLLCRQNFPYGTLVVNITGSFLVGLLFIVLWERAIIFAPQLRSFILIGFLGGFTTFSAFSLETMLLLSKHEIYAAMLNIILSIVLSITATSLGMFISNRLLLRLLG